MVDETALQNDTEKCPNCSSSKISKTIKYDRLNKWMEPIMRGFDGLMEETKYVLTEETCTCVECGHVWKKFGEIAK